jgi:hypothetical protein
MNDDGKTVAGIVADWLREHGYEGLYWQSGDCGCELADLMPCGEPNPSCKAGYRGPCDEHCELGGGCDFHILKSKP